MSGPAAFLKRFGWTAWEDALPLAIAHRGASDHAPENTLKAMRVAAELGAEMWEIDVRVAACGTVVVSHDATLERVAGDPRAIAQTMAAELKTIALPDGERMPTLTETIALAKALACGLYIELKDAASGPATLRALEDTGFERAVIGAFDPSWIAPLREAGSAWPLSVLVPKDVDPLSYAAPASPDIIHLCWLGADDRPDTLLTDALIDAIHRSGAAIVTWHEDRAEVIDALQGKPLLGICSNRPEVLKPAKHTQPIAYVCHRGANTFAPENTIEAARIAFDQRFDFVEIDVRTTKDGHIVVMHDATVDRTTNGTGLVDDLTLEEIRALDAGAWFSDIHRGTTVPTLAEMLAFARGRGGIYVELKAASPREVLDLVEAAGMLSNTFFWGADTDALHYMRARSADVMLMAPRWMYRSVEEAHADYQAQIIELDVTRDDVEEVAICRAMGLKSMIYSQSHAWDDLARYHALAPDMVNLDRPDRFKLIADYGWRDRTPADEA